jgi:hypothetical protein
MARYTYKPLTEDDKVVQSNEATYFVWYLDNNGAGTDGSGDRWVDTSISS